MTILPWQMIKAPPWRWAFAIILTAALFFRAVVGFAAPPAPGTAIVNTAPVQYQDANGNPLFATSNTVTVLLAATSQLRLNMTADTDPVIAGNTITYTLEVENTGRTLLTGITLSDLLPVGTTFVSVDNDGVFSAGERQVAWSINYLEAGQRLSIKLTLQVNREIDTNQEIVNTATATAIGSTPQTLSLSSRVRARSPGSVEFFNTAWQPAYGYMSGDTIYLQVEDLDQNINPTSADSVTVLLQNQKVGDTETVLLTETGPDTGIFRNTGMLTTLDVISSNDGRLTVVSNSRILATYTDPLDVSPAFTASALIDPLGIVFDAVTGIPVAGAVVTLRNWDSATNVCNFTSHPVLPGGQVNPAPPTEIDGKFAFPLVPIGDYCFEVTPGPDYIFPSTVPDSALPAGFTIGNGSRGEKFTLRIGDPPLICDIPIDPPGGSLLMTKSANKSMASIGDFISYSVKITNVGTAAIQTITIIDTMPHGILYLEGSSRLDAGDITEPTHTGGKNTLTWNLPDLAPGNSWEIFYRSIVGPDSSRGDGVNSAFATGVSLGRAIVSNTARLKVKINGGVFTEKGTILGKIFHDRDGNRLQNQPVTFAEQKKPDEGGIANVILYLEDGTRVTTDSQGKFSILGIMPGTHVLRVDETTLPQGVTLSTLSNRFLGDGASQIVDMGPGGLLQADFAVKKEEKEEVLTAVPTETGSLSTESAGAVSIKSDSDWAEEIKTMTPDLAFLSPIDESVVIRDRIRVILKTPLATTPFLTLNNVPIDPKQIGRKIDYAQGQVTIYEYIDIHLNTGEANLLKAESRDTFGILRGSKEITVTTAGAPEKILIAIARPEVPADGVSLIQVDVSARDRNNMIVSYAAPATVSVSAGEFMEKDIDPNQEGFQISLNNGVGHFTLRAPRQAEEAVITVDLAGRQETAKVFFSPHLRNLFLVGIGEVTIGQGRGKGENSFLRENSRFKDGFYSGGKGAFFLKGKIYEDLLLTAAYDSEKERRDDLFRETDTNLDSEDKYPIYGDESKTGYEAVATGQLYLKLEKNRSSLLYGDYRTDLNDTTLSTYNRSFNGLKYVLNTEKFNLCSFGSYTDQTQVLDVLPGKGISGYYYLTMRSLIAGSERVVIETRDRYRPENVLRRDLKVRGSDYEIDYDLGTLLFKEPIPSHNGDYNPLYIIVSYENRTYGDKYYIYGGRAAFNPTSWLEVGVTEVIEEKKFGTFRLQGTDLTLTLPYQTVVKAEYAGTRALVEEESLLTMRSDNAWSVKLGSAAIEKFAFAAYYRKVGDDFLNVSAVDAARGTTKYGLDASYDLRAETRIRGQFFDERDELNSMNHRLGSIGLQTKFKKTKISGEIANETASDSYIPLTNPDNRSPFDISEETPDSLTSASVGIETELRPDLNFTANHKQNLSSESYHMSQAGLNYQLNNQNRLYLREEYQKYQERNETRTLLGVETQLISNTVAYNEYRLADGADGSRNQNVIGLRNKFFLNKDVTGNVAAEYLKTVSGAERSEEPDALAGSLGLEYLPNEEVKMTGRVEHRRELNASGTDSWLGELGLAYKLHPDYSLLFRERYFIETAGSGGEHTTSRNMVGIAYRPLLTNCFNALAKMEYKHESNETAIPALSENSWIFSGAGVWQATSQLQLTAKYAGKLSRNDDVSSYTDLVATRFLYDLTERWDVGGEYRILTSYDVHSVYQGGALEIGCRVIKNLWVATGYSFDKFDADLVGDGYQGEGPYLKIRVKFDEKSFPALEEKIP